MISDDQLRTKMDAINAHLEQNSYDRALTISRQTLAAVVQDGSHIPEIQGVLQHFVGRTILSAYEEACHDKGHPNFSGRMTYWMSLLPEGYDAINSAVGLLPGDESAKWWADKYDHLASTTLYFRTGTIREGEPSEREAYFELVEEADHATRGEDFEKSLECCEAALKRVPEAEPNDAVPPEVHALLHEAITIGQAFSHFLEAYAGKHDQSKDESRAAILLWARHLALGRQSAHRALTLAPNLTWLQGIADGMNVWGEELQIRDGGGIGAPDVDGAIGKLAFAELIKNTQAEHRDGKLDEADRTLELAEPLMSSDGNALVFHTLKALFTLGRYGSIGAFEQGASTNEVESTLCHIERALSLSQSLGTPPDGQFTGFQQQLTRMLEDRRTGISPDDAEDVVRGAVPTHRAEQSAVVTPTASQDSPAPSLDLTASSSHTEKALRGAVQQGDACTHAESVPSEEAAGSSPEAPAQDSGEDLPTSPAGITSESDISQVHDATLRGDVHSGSGTAEEMGEGIPGQLHQAADCEDGLRAYDDALSLLLADAQHSGQDEGAIRRQIAVAIADWYQSALSSIAACDERGVSAPDTLLDLADRASQLLPRALVEARKASELLRGDAATAALLERLEELRRLQFFRQGAQSTKVAASSATGLSAEAQSLLPDVSSDAPGMPQVAEMDGDVVSEVEEHSESAPSEEAIEGPSEDTVQNAAKDSLYEEETTDQPVVTGGVGATHIPRAKQNGMPRWKIACWVAMGCILLAIAFLLANTHKDRGDGRKQPSKATAKPESMPNSPVSIAQQPSTTRVPSSRETISVPKALDRMAKAEAKQAIFRAGLVPQISWRYSTSISAGKVISTLPEAGSSVAKNSSITLIISKGRRSEGGQEHGKYPFKCRYCKQSFKTLAAWNRHNLVFGGSCGYMFRCLRCKAGFTNRRAYENHMAWHRLRGR